MILGVPEVASLSVTGVSSILISVMSFLQCRIHPDPLQERVMVEALGPVAGPLCNGIWISEVLHLHCLPPMVFVCP